MSIDALQTKIRKMKNPSMLGLDPTPEMIPPRILSEKLETLGQTPQALAAAYETFCTGLLDALAGLIPAVKLQSACFYALGAAGMDVLQRLTEYATEKGYYVLLDWMRSDVGQIAEISAQALFAGVPIGEQVYHPYTVDAITVNAYTGSDGVKPYLTYCKKDGKSLFVVVKTSNKSAHEVQDLLSGDRIVHTAVADLAERWSTGLVGKNGYSEVAIVASASNANSLKYLRNTYERLFLLVPGYGTQGGTGKTVQYAFDRLGHGAIVSASRSLMGAWKQAGTDGRDYQEQAVQAATKMKKDILEYVVIL